MDRLPRAILSGLLLVLLSSCSPRNTELVMGGPDQETRRHSGSCQAADLYPVTDLLSQTQNVGDSEIRLVSWNIYKQKRDGWQNELQELIPRHDIVLLQEAFLEPSLLQLLEGEELYWQFNNSFSYFGVATGVLTASHTAPSHSCGVRIKEPITGLPKTLLISKYQLGDATPPLMVANLHGINLTTGTKTYEKQFMILYQLLKRHQGPLIVAGDFNNWSRERMAIVEAFKERMDLLQVELGSTNRTLFFGRAVDHFLYRGLTLQEKKTTPTESSDHNPFEVIFKLPTASKQ